jgi:phage-related holin
MKAPAAAASYAKTTFTGSFSAKWIPAGLVALFVDMAGLFDQLFFIVIMLWGCDFLIGFLKAWHDPNDGLEWMRAFRSVLKLLVIAIGVVAIHLVEQMVAHQGIDTQQKLTVATLLVIGVTEAVSILDNLCYFFPAMDAVAKRIKAVMGKARNGDQ